MRFATGAVVFVAGLLLLGPSADIGRTSIEWALRGYPMLDLSFWGAAGCLASIALIWFGALNAKIGWKE